MQQALKLLETERKVERQLFQVHCDYAQLNWIQILCEQHQIEIYQQDFQVQITLQLGISEDQIKPSSNRRRVLNFRSWYSSNRSC